MDQKPSIGRIVHYRALGSADGKFPVGECRAAVITAVISDTKVDLCVLNPTGMYFNHNCDLNQDKTETGGTWHWPERV